MQAAESVAEEAAVFLAAAADGGAFPEELRHKKADKLTTADVQSLNAAREALSAIATPLVTQWESEKG